MMLASAPVKARRGITLVEVTIVLAIMGIIVGGIWALTASAMNNRKKAHLANQVVTITANVRNYYQRQDGLTTPANVTAASDLRAKQLLPADMIKSTGLQHAYGGNVAVNFDAGRTFSIVLLGVPADACSDLLYARLGNNNQLVENLGLFAYTGATGGAQTVFPITLASINTLCANPTNLTLFFRL